MSCLQALPRICGHHGLLPQSLKLLLNPNPAKIQRDPNSPGIPLSKGRFADLWKCECEGRSVGVKVLRGLTGSKCIQKETVG